MAIDLVKPLKYETPDGGTETDIFETEANPDEDYVQGHGFAVDENTYIDKDSVSNELKFTDSINGAKKLSELGGATEEFVIAMSISLG